MKTLLNSMILLTSMNDLLMPFGESRGAFFHPQIDLIPLGGILLTSFET